MAEPFPLLDLQGTPTERGRAHGAGASARIKAGAAHYGEQLAARGFTGRAVDGLLERLLPHMERFDAGYVAEMRAIAEGADVPLSTVALINARTEVLKLAEAAEADPDGCTGVVVMPEASADGQLIHAQNWDWKRECADTSVVLRVRNAHGPDYLTFTEAGGLARSGFNAAGVAITANYLECERDYRTLGVPLALIRRRVLESAHLAMAVRAVRATPKSASNNMMLSHAGGQAFSFECAPDESFVLHPDRGLLVHANHWVCADALAKLRDTGVGSVPDSVYRDVRVRGLLQPLAGRIGVPDVQAALFDDYQSPWSVCRPPRPSASSSLTPTVAMLVMEPARGLLHATPLPALNRHATTYALNP